MDCGNKVGEMRHLNMQGFEKVLASEMSKNVYILKIFVK